jgi:hypothetical protein
MKLSNALPGVVWIAIGIGVHVYCTTTNTPLVIRGTTWPWSIAVIVTGVIIALLGLWRGRKQL